LNKILEFFKSEESLKVLSWVVLAIVLIVVFWQAQLPQWQGHLQYDAVTFQTRANYFLKHLSWAGMGYNEYLPGSLWFFVLIGRLANPESFRAFLQVLFLANILLIIGHFLFFLRASHKYAPILFSLLVLAAGPILLFRFELLVSLLVLVAWYFFGQKKYGWSAFVLGLGTSIKIYPAVLFPLLVFDLLRKKNWRSTIIAVLAFGAGIALPILFFLLFGGDLAGFWTSVQVHSLKPVGVEGLWGNLVAFMNMAFGSSFFLTPGYGVYGFTPGSSILSIANLNQLPIIVTIILLAVIGWFYRKKGYNEVGPAFIVIFVFTLLGKVLNPQYLWWFLVFLPLFPLKWFSKIGWTTIYLMAFASLVLTQIIYPLNYDAFLEWFKVPIDPSQFLALLSLRDLLLLIILGFGVFALLRSRAAKS